MSSPTWSDLNSASVVPPLGARNAPDLGSVGVMVSCRPDVDLIKKKLVSPRVTPFFNNTLIIPADDMPQICVAGPYMGAPYGTMILESLIARGVKKIIVLGWCGAVVPGLDVGDLIVVDRAIVDEGTSCNYADLSDDIPCTLPDDFLTSHLYTHCQKTVKKNNQSSGKDAGRDRRPEKRPFRVTRQTLWTTDAIYRETPEKISFFRDLGAEAVEMECSALFSVARFRAVKIAALMVVSDSVAATDWHPGFRNKRFKQARALACEMVLDVAGQLEAND
jgi:purine-nucleoside phosphorylase